MKKGKKVVANAVVTPSGGAATGTVQIVLDGKVVGTATLSGGKAKIKVKTKKLSLGKHTLLAKYLGTANISPSQKTFKVKIIPK